MGVVPSPPGSTPVRIDITIRFEFPAPMIEALTLLLSQVRPVAATVASADEPSAPAAQKRRRGRPRKQSDAEMPEPICHVSFDDLTALFVTVVGQPGGELLAATVLRQFGICSIAQADQSRFPVIFQALKCALTRS